MVDGGMELRIGVLPLAIQILSSQRATMAAAETKMSEECREEQQSPPI